MTYYVLTVYSLKYIIVDDMTTKTLDLRIKADENLIKKVEFLKESLGLTNGELVKFSISRLYEAEQIRYENMDTDKLVDELVAAQAKMPDPDFDELEKIVEQVKSDLYNKRNRRYQLTRKTSLGHKKRLVV